MLPLHEAPDIVLMQPGQVGRGFVYEIKPDTPYGHTTGPKALRRYLSLLTACGLNVLPGGRLPATDRPPGPMPPTSCGVLDWKLDSSGLILYTWRQRRRRPTKVPVGVPYPYLPSAIAVSEEATTAAGATATVEAGGATVELVGAAAGGVGIEEIAVGIAVVLSPVGL